MRKLIEAKLGLYRPKDVAKGLKVQIANLIERQPVYAVVEVFLSRQDGSSEKFKVSGSLLRLQNWISDIGDEEGIKSFSPVIVGISTDRNWARKQATEI